MFHVYILLNVYKIVLPSVSIPVIKYKNENIIIIPKAENIQKKGLSPYPQIIQSKYEPNFGNNFSDFRSIHLPR